MTAPARGEGGSNRWRLTEGRAARKPLSFAAVEFEAQKWAGASKSAGTPRFEGRERRNSASTNRGEPKDGRLGQGARLSSHLVSRIYAVMNPEFIAHPTENHLNQIREGLEAEDLATGEGFLCNWNIIKDCFRDDRVVCATEGEKALSFRLPWASFAGG